MTTVAYCAISDGGRVHRDTMVLDSRRAKGIAPIDRRRARREHAGLRPDRPCGSGRQHPVQPSENAGAVDPGQRPAMGPVRGATIGQLDQVISDFGAAARNAVDAGFDATRCIWVTVVWSARSSVRI